MGVVYVNTDCVHAFYCISIGVGEWYLTACGYASYFVLTFQGCQQRCLSAFKVLQHCNGS